MKQPWINKVFYSSILYSSNDVNYGVSNMALRLYADDTTGYNSDNWSLALQFMVNKNLSSLPTWFKQNLLSINNT